MGCAGLSGGVSRVMAFQLCMVSGHFTAFYSLIYLVVLDALVCSVSGRTRRFDHYRHRRRADTFACMHSADSVAMANLLCPSSLPSSSFVTSHSGPCLVLLFYSILSGINWQGQRGTEQGNTRMWTPRSVGNARIIAKFACYTLTLRLLLEYTFAKGSWRRNLRPPSPLAPRRLLGRQCSRSSLSLLAHQSQIHAVTPSLTKTEDRPCPVTSPCRNPPSLTSQSHRSPASPSRPPHPSHSSSSPSSPAPAPFPSPHQPPPP